MKTALVVGCADCVWDEVEAAQKLATFDQFYVCKMAGIDWDEGWFHWVTLHPEYMIGERGYKQTRINKGLPNDYEIVAPLTGEVGNHWHIEVDRRVSMRWPQINAQSSSGSSGLYAVKVALDDGCDRIVLAGVPMLGE